MNSFVQGGSLRTVFKQEALEMQKDITPGSAPAFPIHCLQTWCLPAGGLCSDPKSLAAAIPPPIHTWPAPLSLLPPFPLLFPPSIQFSHSFDPSQEH